jgi:hypothetical protein
MCRGRVLAWCVLLSHNLLCPIILIVLLSFEACCGDTSPQRLALATHLGAGSTSQLAPKGIERLARLCFSVTLSNGGRREFPAIPGAAPPFFDRYCGVVEGLVEDHAPLEALLKPLQRHNLHPPTKSMLVLLARWGRCDEVRDGFGEIAMILGPIAVDCLLDVSSLFGCASSALFHLRVLGLVRLSKPVKQIFNPRKVGTRCSASSAATSRSSCPSSQISRIASSHAGASTLTSSRHLATYLYLALSVLPTIRCVTSEVRSSLMVAPRSAPMLPRVV